jgi:hypothetical protein
MLKLAAKAVARVDQQGERGITLVTMDEIAALAGVAVLSGLLSGPDAAPSVNETPIFKSVRMKV